MSTKALLMLDETVLTISGETPTNLAEQSHIDAALGYLSRARASLLRAQMASDPQPSSFPQVEFRNASMRPDDEVIDIDEPPAPEPVKYRPEQPLPLRPPRPSRHYEIGEGSALRRSYDQFIADLPALYAETTGRIRVALVQERYRPDYNEALKLLRTASHEGLGIWRTFSNGVGKGVYKALVPNNDPDTDVPVPTGVDAQRVEKVYSVLCKNVDASKCVQLAQPAISIRAGVPLNLIGQIIEHLIAQKRIMLARPRHGVEAPIYQVLS